MFAEELKAFKKRHGIKSADEWSKVTGVSKSTITRGLNGDGKDMGINTLLMLTEPYGETLDQVLGKGAYSEEEQGKNELVEKLESTIDEIDNSPAIPEDTAQDIKSALEEAQQFISATPQIEECAVCKVLREMIAMQDDDKQTKNTWIRNLIKICLVLLAIIFAMTIIDGVLIASLIQILNP